MITCEFEDGGRGALRHVAVDTIVTNADGEVLLVKRAERLTEGGKWALPGGFLDRDEHPDSAAAREVLEETGYECTAVTFAFVNADPHRRHDERQNISLTYTAKVGEKSGEPDDESSAVAWFSFAELPPLDAFAFDHRESIERVFAPTN